MEVTVTHDCGMCDGPLEFMGKLGRSYTFNCRACGWWHTSQDCCTDEINNALAEA